MTEPRRVAHRPAWLSPARLSPALLPVAVIAFATLLQGCDSQRGSSGSANRVFAVDLAGGARTCTPSRPDLTDGKTTTATITMGNDGGWCAISVRRNGGPYDTGLLTTRPTHGKVLIHRVGDDTRLTYTPDRGYVGRDAFTVRLLPGDAVVETAVTVNAP